MSPKKLDALTVTFTLAYAAVTLFTLTLGAVQLGWAYFSGHGLDVDVATFLVVGLIFLLVAYATMRKLHQMMFLLGLKRRAKEQIIIAEYDLEGITPVEAGIIIDTYSNHQELSSILKQLQHKKWIEIERHQSKAVIVQNLSGDELTKSEQVFYFKLFSRTNRLELPLAADYVKKAFSEMTDSISEDLKARGLIKPKASTIRTKLDKFLRGVALFFQIIVLMSLFSPDSYRVLYPRYPVHLWQLVYILLLIGIVVGVPLYSYLQEVYSKKGWDTYRRVAGLYLFLKVALKDQLQTRHLANSELKKYEAYALAFGLITSDDELDQYLL